MNNCKRKMKYICTTAAIFGMATLTFGAAASAQVRITSPQVFDGQTVFHVSDNLKPVQIPVDLSSSNGTLVAANDTGASSLPDAPSAILRGAYEPTSYAIEGAQNTHAIVAPLHTKYIPAGWTAQPLTGHDKVVLGLKDSVSPFSFLGIVFSAGYSQVTKGQPNYGTDSGAFGQRLGATAIRDTMEGILTDSVFSPLLREDPRYYVEGNQHNFIHRVIYAATRPIITRTDGGRQTINGALLLAYAASSATSYAYYPSINQNFKDTVATFGGGLGGAAVGDVVSEFSDGVLIALHLKKAQ